MLALPIPTVAIYLLNFHIYIVSNVSKTWISEFSMLDIFNVIKKITTKSVCIPWNSLTTVWFQEGIRLWNISKSPSRKLKKKQKKTHFYLYLSTFNLREKKKF